MFSVSVPPVVTNSPMAMLNKLSPMSLTLTCSADGLPQPIIAWVRTLDDGTDRIFNTSSVLENGRNILVSNSNPSSLNTSSTFSVTTTFATDSANYTCIATNRLGSDTSNKSMVSVFGKII